MVIGYIWYTPCRQYEHIEQIHMCLANSWDLTHTTLFPLKLIITGGGKLTFELTLRWGEVWFNSSKGSQAINRVSFEFGLCDDPATWNVDILVWSVRVEIIYLLFIDLSKITELLDDGAPIQGWTHSTLFLVIYYTVCTRNDTQINKYFFKILLFIKIGRPVSGPTHYCTLLLSLALN